MNKKIIKDGKIVEDNWELLIDETVEPGNNTILPLASWQKHSNKLSESVQYGLSLNSDQDLQDLPDNLDQIPVIAIYFPAFTDGRGFSIASLLRQRYNYKGEIRACGYFIRDQLTYLSRCGFNAFDFSSGGDLASALNSLSDFSDNYQADACNSLPLFRRRTG